MDIKILFDGKYYKPLDFIEQIMLNTEEHLKDKNYTIVEIHNDEDKGSATNKE